MSWARVTAARIRGLFGRGRLERQLDDELRFHLEMQAEDNMRAGMPPAEAMRAARREFGTIDSVKEEYRERRAFAWIEATVLDLRYALRSLRKSPAYSVTAVATLALAIGANTAMFSVLHAVIFQPLPFHEPDRLAMLWSEVPSQQVREGRTAYGSFEQWRAQSESFTGMAVYDPGTATLSTAAGELRISGARVSADLFPLLGVQPLHGRVFSPEESERRERVAMISHRFWQSHFAGSRDALASTLVVNGLPLGIIGVLPANIEHAGFDADVTEPLTLSRTWDQERAARGPGPWFVIGRLRADATIEKAQAEMTAIARRLDERAAAPGPRPGISVVPLPLQITGPKARLALWLLSAAVAFVLLIAATNVASLSLARAASREREIVIRGALGASRARIVRQLLAESLTLSLISGLLGLAIAEAGIRAIVAFQPSGLARTSEAGLHPQVLGAAMALCLFTGVLVGLAPAITLARGSARLASPEGGRSVSSGVAARGLRRALVLAEFALAVMLLAGAGLLIRSLMSVEAVDPGFRTERILALALAAPASYSVAERTGFYDNVLEQVASVPGVEGTSIIGDVFIGGNPERDVTVEGESRASAERLRFRSDEASAGFFKLLGVPLLSGRDFSPVDRADAPRVAIVNHTMARRLWPGRDPIGKRFKFGPVNSRAPWRTVVGVVGDMRRQGLENEPIPQMFEPVAQNPSRLAVLLVRTATDDPLRMSAPVQTAVRRAEKLALVYGVSRLEDLLGRFLEQRRFQTTLLTGFSAVALLMAAIGIYGLMQYSISTRTREIGIRMAIGAQSGSIFRMIVGEGLKLSLLGLALGLTGALLLGRAGESFLFGITATDSATYLTVSVLLTAVAVAACYFPARRAMKVEPVTALRQA